MGTLKLLSMPKGKRDTCAGVSFVVMPISNAVDFLFQQFNQIGTRSTLRFRKILAYNVLMKSSS
jgi:hypothetical protein